MCGWHVERLAMMIPSMISVRHVVIVLAVGAILWLWFDRQEAWETVAERDAVIALHNAQAEAQKAEAERKAKAWADAKRKADNEAQSLRKRVAWLQGQAPKGCEDAASLIKAYRTQK